MPPTKVRKRWHVYILWIVAPAALLHLANATQQQQLEAPQFSQPSPQQFPDYTPDTYPDSQSDWTLCGMTEKSLLCDPNRLLNPDVNGQPGGLKLHKALQHLRQSTNCTCDDGPTASIQCLTGSQSHGYTLSIGVLRKIRLDPQDQQSTEQAMRIFTDVLRNRLYRGQCDDDVLVVLSVEDNAVWTSTGVAASKKITQTFVQEMSGIALSQYFNRQDYTGGLLYMVHTYAARLGAEPIGHGVTIDTPEPIHHQPTWFDTHLWIHLPDAWRVSAWRWWILAGVLFVLLALFILLVIGVGWLVKWVYREVRHRRAGYYPGRSTR